MLSLKILIALKDVFNFQLFFGWLFSSKKIIDKTNLKLLNAACPWTFLILELYIILSSIQFFSL